MNDILSWYGYENVDKSDTSSSSTIKFAKSNDDGCKRTKGRRQHHNGAEISIFLKKADHAGNNHATDNDSVQSVKDGVAAAAASETPKLTRKSSNPSSITLHGESSTSEKDSSRESSKSPLLMKMLDKQQGLFLLSYHYHHFNYYYAHDPVFVH
jgi:hypothetical protein